MNEDSIKCEKINFISMFAKEFPPCDLMVIDEGHHFACASAVHADSASRASLILGLSATPFRTDRMQLSFEKIIKDAGIHRLIHDNYLCPFEHWIMEERWNATTVAGIYLREPEKWGKSVAFFFNHRECYKFQEILADKGIHCEVITHITDREKQLDEFGAGKFNIVANMAILTEGFDCPELKTVFVRDSSKLPTIQMAGRGLRKYEGKEHFNVVQSKHTNWPFNRTARPKHSYAQVNSKWLDLDGDSKAIEEAMKINMIKMIQSATKENLLFNSKYWSSKRNKKRRRIEH